MVHVPVVLIVGDMNVKQWLAHLIRTYPDRISSCPGGILYDDIQLRIQEDPVCMPDIVFILTGRRRVIQDYIPVFKDVCPMVYLGRNTGSLNTREWNNYIYADKILLYIISVVVREEARLGYRCTIL